jgi:hypothetical protein
MILDIYKDSFEFSSRKIPNLLLLGLLSFFSVLIIPAIFFYGYNYRVVKLSTQSMINGEDVPPEFSEFKRMFIDGLKYIIVNLAYIIIPLLIIISPVFTNTFNWIILLVGIILFFICSLFACLAIPHMASNDDSLKSAFELSNINKIMSSIGYGRYILFYIGVIIISVVIFAVVFLILTILLVLLGIASANISVASLGAVSAFGTIITTFVISFLVAPYLTMFQNRCVGLIYSLGS